MKGLPELMDKVEELSKKVKELTEQLEAKVKAEKGKEKPFIDLTELEESIKALEGLVSLTMAQDSLNTCDENQFLALLAGIRDNIRDHFQKIQKEIG